MEKVTLREWGKWQIPNHANNDAQLAQPQTQTENAVLRCLWTIITTCFFLFHVWSTRRFWLWNLEKVWANFPGAWWLACSACRYQKGCTKYQCFTSVSKSVEVVCAFHIVCACVSAKSQHEATHGIWSPLLVTHKLSMYTNRVSSLLALLIDWLLSSCNAGLPVGPGLGWCWEATPNFPKLVSIMMEAQLENNACILFQISMMTT